MSQPPSETPPEQQQFRTPRSSAVEGLLLMAEELLIARFALMRCMDKLDLVQLLDVFDEVSETLTGHELANVRRIVTPRDRK